MKKILLGGIAAIGMMTTGCMSTVPITRTASNIPVEQGKYTLVKERVSGVCDQWMGPFGITLDLSFNESAQRIASDMALEQASGADALVNITTEFKTFNFLGLFHRFRTHVTADAVKLNK